MTWFKVDDGLYDHAKMLDLRSRSGWQSALALWTLAGAWSSKQLKDGVVPKTLIAYVGCSGSDADLLVDVGLWERTEDGFQFHDWLDCNPSRDSVEERRKKTRDKVANWRSRNQVTERLVTSPVTEVVTLPPSRPVPSRPDQGEERASAPPLSVVPASQPASSSAQESAFDELLRAEAFKRDVTTPSLTKAQRGAAVARVMDYGKRRSLRFEDASLAVIRQAFDNSAATGEKFCWALADCEPGKKPGPRGGAPQGNQAPEGVNVWSRTNFK